MQPYTNPTLELDQIPTIKGIDFKPLAAKYPLLSAIETVIFWLIPMIPLLIVYFVKGNDKIPLFVLFIFPALALLGALLAYFGARAKGYAVREKDIIYKQGLLWKKQTCVSFKRIQHIDIANGPIERHFDLNSIKFFTAGGAMADLKIAGLETQNAEKLRQYILEKIGLLEETDEVNDHSSSDFV